MTVPTERFNILLTFMLDPDELAEALGSILSLVTPLLDGIPVIGELMSIDLQPLYLGFNPQNMARKLVWICMNLRT